MVLERCKFFSKENTPVTCVRKGNLMRKLMMLLMAMACFGMTGCASHLMQHIDSTAINTQISQEESAIVFFRATSIGGGVQAPVIEVSEDGKISFVAIISAATKYLHRTTSGKHLYVVGGESSEMLEADMEAGKTYYAYVSPRMGWWKARFVFVPVPDVTDETFKKDLAWCDWVQNTSAGDQWFLDNFPSLQKKYTDALKEHQAASQADKKLILPGFGSAIPAQ